MRRMGFGFALVVLPVVVTAPAAMAANPHFRRSSASGPDAAGALRVSFKLAGLGGSGSTSVIAVADATTVYACQATDGKILDSVVTGPTTVSGDGQFGARSGGQISESLFLSPPSSSLACPSGAQLVLAQVSHTRVQLFEPAAGSADVAGTFTRTFVVT